MELDNFVSKLKRIYGDNLKSIVLFGSAVGQSPLPKRNLDLMLVLASLELERLVAGARLIRRWMRHGNPEPLFIDMARIATSLDVFPIEFSDMQARHQILYGEDPLQHITIEQPALRLQCEREIKQKILLLREHLITVYPRRRALRRLLLESAGSSLAIVRGTLRVIGETVAATSPDQVRQLSARSEVDLNPLLEILADRHNEKRIPTHRVPSLLEGYLTSLEELATYIDQL